MSKPANCTVPYVLGRAEGVFMGLSYHVEHIITLLDGKHTDIDKAVIGLSAISIELKQAAERLERVSAGVGGDE